MFVRRRYRVTPLLALLPPWALLALPLAAGAVTTLPAVETTLTAPVPRDGAHYGGAIDACDDLLVVGARDDDLFANNGGAVYVYRKTPSGLVYSVTLEPPMADMENNLWFGGDVALICGAPLQFIAVGFVPTGPDLGGAYIFERTGPDSWELVEKVVPAVGRNQDDWGTVVAADAWYDDQWIYRVALGGPDAHSLTTSADFVGAVAVFQRNTKYQWDAGGGLFQANETLIPGDQGVGDDFGAAVGLRGPWMVVGAPGDDSATGLDAGAVYFFTDGVQRSKLQPSGIGVSALFGSDVSVDLFWIAVASPNDPDAFNPNGAVYLYSIFGFPNLLPAPPVFVVDEYTQRLTLPASQYLAKVVIDTPYLLAGRNDDETSLSLFVRTGLDTWSLEGTTEPSTINHLVSGGIAMDGSVLYGGVPGEMVTGLSQAGSVYAWDVIELRPLFADGFESGGTSAWAAVVP